MYRRDEDLRAIDDTYTLLLQLVEVTSLPAVPYLSPYDSTHEPTKSKWHCFLQPRRKLPRGKGCLSDTWVTRCYRLTIINGADSTGTGTLDGEGREANIWTAARRCGERPSTPKADSPYEDRP